MEISADFKELLELLNDRNVDYVIVGGYALAHHGAPRFTGDLDILVNPDAANASKVIRVLDDFGFASLGLAANDFESDDNVIQLGVPPVRIDILTSLTGVSWEQVFSGRVKAELGGVPVHVIGRDQLITNKKALGRKRDLADLEAIGAL
jgi:predicted nucleotidyltransferase